MIPDLLTSEQLKAIRAELAHLPTKAVDYSDNQRGYANVQWTDSPVTIQTIALPKMISFLT
ncbi:MAG: hypothetical protein ACK58T_09280, partial [Phycisphaerae bacterium]